MIFIIRHTNKIIYKAHSSTISHNILYQAPIKEQVILISLKLLILKLIVVYQTNITDKAI